MIALRFDANERCWSAHAEGGRLRWRRSWDSTSVEADIIRAENVLCVNFTPI